MVDIKLEEITSIKPITDEKKERHLYQKGRPKKIKSKDKNISKKDKKSKQLIDIYA